MYKAPNLMKLCTALLYARHNKRVRVVSEHTAVLVSLENESTMTRRCLFAVLLLLLTGETMPPLLGQTSVRHTPTASFTPVTPKRLINAETEPQNWMMYCGNYKSQRYSRLDQVNRLNVAQLEIQWVHQLQALDQAETTPLVIDGGMYITESPSPSSQSTRQAADHTGDTSTNYLTS